MSAGGCYKNLYIKIMLDLDLVCFSHLRWNFVFQRPQHLLTRFSKQRRVFYIEEPEYSDQPEYNHVTQSGENLWVVVPYLQRDLSSQEQIGRRINLLSDFFRQMSVKKYFFWFYTPMALPVSEPFNPALVVYDCMDELSAFKFAPGGIKEQEDDLFKKADIVFTGGQSLYEAKKDRHNAIYPFPSSIDKSHFQKARNVTQDPPDQALIPRPRIGFYGVIDERMNLELIANVAAKRPAWQFVMIGPITKIDPDALPRKDNIHYIGNKSYQELPEYLSGWNIAMIPFALNESTRFISPTKTPEYLSAGKPVISSSIRDVVRPYGDQNLVHIADTSEDFIKAVEKELNVSDRTAWLAEVDAFLQQNSWEITWEKMMRLIDDKLAVKAQDTHTINLNLKENIYV